MKKPVIIILGIIALITPYLCMVFMKIYYDNKLENIHKASFLIIDKEAMDLEVVNLNGDVIERFPVGVGKNYGNKIEKGDNRTPEGIFRISEIQNSSNWKHDFGDGEGVIEGSYGPYFIRLYTEPHKGIGIHGTHLPSSIGTRCTEGCIRLYNENVEKLKDIVYTGMPVIILPSQEDILVNLKNTKE